MKNMSLITDSDSAVDYLRLVGMSVIFAALDNSGMPHWLVGNNLYTPRELVTLANQIASELNNSETS